MQLFLKSFLLTFVLLLLLSSFLYAKKPEKMVKRNYKIAYKSIKEWSYRMDPADKRVQKAEISQQSMAFLKIAEALVNQPDDKLKKTIEVALLRWGWLEGDPMLENPHQVDYFMVWMELRQKRPERFEPIH
jgi:hypothetical protein